MTRTLVSAIAWGAASCALAADSPFVTTIEPLPNPGSLSVRVRVHNPTEQALNFDKARTSRYVRNFAVTDPNGKAPVVIGRGREPGDAQLVEVPPGETVDLYEGLYLGALFLLDEPGNYQVLFRGWETDAENSDLQSVPPAGPLALTVPDRPIPHGYEYIRRLLSVKPAGWRIVDYTRAVYLKAPAVSRDAVVFSDLGVYGTMFTLEHPGDGSAGSPRATIKLWTTNPKGTRQVPTLSGNPAGRDEWVFLTTLSKGDIYFRAEVDADDPAVIEKLWPDAQETIRDALTTGGPGGLTDRQRDALSDSWGDVPVVRTWGELRALPPFNLSGKVRARFGIDALSAPTHGSVLVYWLVDSEKPDGLTEGVAEFAPIATLLLQGFGGDPRIQPFGFSIVTAPPSATREVLYASSIVMGDLDQYLEFSIPWYAAPFARGVVRNSGGDFHPWIPLPNVAGARDPERVKVRTDMVHAPFVSGSIPLSRTGGGQDVPDGAPLPPLIPTEPSIRLELAGTSDRGLELVVSCDQGLHTAEAGKEYLSRWWVNGEPFVPEDAPLAGPWREREALPPSGARHRFEIEFEPGQIGAEEGDRIELQLLYVPDGPPIKEGPVRNERIAGLQRMPALTNRIEFVAR